MEDKRIVGVDEVCISKDEYVELLRLQRDYEILENSLLDNASLSWNKRYLEFNGCDVSLVLNIISPYAYGRKMTTLKEEADGTDND